jgi:NhaP-type Na+/H+ or K+/H+ antiporter
VNATALATMSVLLFGWATISGALSRHNVTGPLVFAAVGYLIANPDFGALSIDVDNSTIHAVAEVTLALVLFADAARVNVTELRHDLSLPLRLLAIALPLSIVAGGALAAAIVIGLPWALALFVGAALAPTDAALSAAVINDERVPLRLRRALNVESGLNDGIATPIVTIAIAIAATQIGLTPEAASFEVGVALREIAVGVGVGLICGLGGAVTLELATRRSWIAHGGRRLAALGIALSAFEIAVAVDANGFIAAFVAGISFGFGARGFVAEVDEIDELPELGGELLALVVWFLFGGSLLPVAFDDVDGRTIAYAALSLTAIRMIPVVMSMWRTGLDRASTVFVAWFGPRGLASVVFALLALEELGEDSAPVEVAVAVVVTTVLASVVLHGVTAGPGAQRLVASEQAAGPPPRARPERLVRPSS